MNLITDCGESTLRLNIYSILLENNRGNSSEGNSETHIICLLAMRSQPVCLLVLFFYYVSTMLRLQRRIQGYKIQALHSVSQPTLIGNLKSLKLIWLHSQRQLVFVYIFFLL